MMTLSPVKRLLVVDDDEAIRGLISTIAEAVGYEVVVEENGRRIEAAVRRHAPQLILLDLQMPEVDGVEVLRRLAGQKLETEIMVLSGSDGRVLATAERLGKTLGLNMQPTLQKPFDIEELRRRLQASHDRWNAASFSADELKAAIDAGWIEPHYQPKAHLVEQCVGKIVGVEALARLHHPKRGQVPPAIFIPLAERADLIQPLTDQIMEAAVSQAAEWRRAGQPLSVSINISALHLDDLTLPDRLERLAAKHEVPPALFGLEITESAAMADAARTMDIIMRFRLKGFGVSMDDFGTGYSSLVQLHRLPFDELKIDKSFVLAMDRDSECEEIVRTVVQLGHSLGLRVCAEGVESKQTLNVLTALGCDVAQGFLIAKPMSGDRVKQAMDAWNYGLIQPSVAS